ncbi:MAG: F0F1 ATP synthase subunit alpha, partial [Proteobacteria bacterium]|nr:F0F1 ATP synthase subunit alpha [Pseudomonadota bacterium]
MDEKLLTPVLDRALRAVQEAVKDGPARPRLEEAGWIVSVQEGIIRLRGLPSARSEELLLFKGGALGMALNLDEDGVGVIMLDESSGLSAGGRVRPTGRVLDVPVGEELLGRVIDPMGRPRDGKGAILAARRMQVERDAPPIMDRAP